MDDFYLAQKHWSMDFEALEQQNDRSSFAALGSMLAQIYT